LRDLFVAHAFDVPRVLLFHPSYQAILLHRLSHFFFVGGHRLLGRFFWHLNLILTGADISPLSRVGGGVVLLHPISTQIFGVVGEGCTFWGAGGIGGGRSAQNIGAGPGLPVVEDGVVFCTRAVVLGPVRVGARSEIGPGCIVYRDLPPGSRIEPIKPRIIRSGASPSESANTADNQSAASELERSARAPHDESV
jgi:serine O-acetyltransferase